MNETLTLTGKWDKAFPKSDKVNHSKVTFHNRYGITLAAGAERYKKQLHDLFHSINPVAFILLLSNSYYICIS